jgi:steroid 5-alpha reductase family enzyme
MSDLYRKEALAHRSRALFGEVRLQAPPATWMITSLLVILVAICLAGLFFFQVQTDEGSLRLIDWMFGADA